MTKFCSGQIAASPVVRKREKKKGNSIYFIFVGLATQHIERKKEYNEAHHHQAAHQAALHSSSRERELVKMKLSPGLSFGLVVLFFLLCLLVCLFLLSSHVISPF